MRVGQVRVESQWDRAENAGVAVGVSSGVQEVVHALDSCQHGYKDNESHGVTLLSSRALFLYLSVQRELWLPSALDNRLSSTKLGIELVSPAQILGDSNINSLM